MTVEHWKIWVKDEAGNKNLMLYCVIIWQTLIQFVNLVLHNDEPCVVTQVVQKY
jgi:hypothetical protein